MNGTREKNQSRPFVSDSQWGDELWVWEGSGKNGGSTLLEAGANGPNVRIQPYRLSRQLMGNQK